MSTNKNKQVIMIYSAIALLVTLILGFIGTLSIASLNIENTITKFTNEKNIKNASSIATYISDNYLEQIQKKINGTLDENSYKAIVKDLFGIKKSHDYKYLYLIYKDPTGNYKYLLDSDYKNESVSNTTYSKFNDSVEYIPEELSLVFDSKNAQSLK